MNLQELIDFHTIGAETCEAYAVTPGAAEDKNKDIGNHYNKRAKWHRDAIALVQGLLPIQDLQQQNKKLEAFIARTPEVVFQGCEFRGFNSDGSEPVEMENGVITRIKLVGWWCEGPMQKNFKGEGLSTNVDPTFVQKRTIKIDTPHAAMPCPPIAPGLPVTAYCGALKPVPVITGMPARDLAAELIEMLKAPWYFEDGPDIDDNRWFKWDWSEHKSRPINKNYLCDVVLADGRVLFGQSPHDFDWSGDDVKAARQAGRIGAAGGEGPLP